MANDFTTQTSNFLSAMSGAVDPRTGQYGYNIVVASLSGNAGLGPDITVALNYSPLVLTNVGYGTGVTLPISRYDKRTRTLTLSTGECYKVSESGKELKILHSKTLHFRAEIKDDGYYLFYKNGTIECLTAPDKGGDIKVTEAIYSPAGHILTLQWENYGNGKRLISINDESSILLNLVYTSSVVTFKLWPDSSETYDIDFRLQNNQLISVTNKGISPSLSWSMGYNKDRLTTITSPTGLKDNVTYSQTGLHFPVGGPSDTLPYVISHRQKGTDGQLIRNLRYSFSDKNFLGYGGSNHASWNNEEDFLYGVGGSYEYSSTETVLDAEGNELSQTIRRYNNYHLQIGERTSIFGTTCWTDTEIIYHDITGASFDDQPPQFQLPRKKTVIWTDDSRPDGSRSRSEITLTEFDDYGNITREETHDGTITEYEYYPAAGDGANCPSESNGFVRFLKKKKITPRSTIYKDTPVAVSEFTYRKLGDSDCVVQDAIRQYADAELLSLRVTDYNSDKNNTEFGRITAITDTLYSAENSFVTKQLFSTHIRDSQMMQIITTIGYDGIKQNSSRTQSTRSGLLLSETDALGVTVNYSYDLLGRLLTRNVAPDTAFSTTLKWQYTIEDEGLITIQTDGKGNQLKTQYDSAGREICQFRLDIDTTNLFYPISSRSYDLLGRPVNSEAHDWLTFEDAAQDFSLQSTVSYDVWGAPQVQAFSDLTQHYRDIDPILLHKSTYQRGGEGRLLLSTGKKITELDIQTGLPLADHLIDSAGQEQGVRRYDWDGLGRLRSDTDERGNTTERIYDVYGRVITQTLPDGSVVQRSYAPYLTGEMITAISVTGQDATGQIQTWLQGTQEFDSIGRVTKSVSGGRTTRYQYEGASPAPSVVTLPSEENLMYTYIPELGNVVSSMTAQGITQTFTYDNVTGELLTALEGDMQTSNTWNSSGSLSVETFTQLGLSNKATYQSTLAGSLHTYTDITGKTTVYHRDVYGRVEGIRDDALTVEMTYDALGRLQNSITTAPDGNSLTTELSYDDFSREITRRVTDSCGTILDVSRTWLPNSLLESSVTTQDGTLQRTELYTYDVRNRLVSYSVAGTCLPIDAFGHEMVAQAYHYDALNNLITVTTTLADGSSNTADYHYENVDDPTQLSRLTNTHPDYPQRIQPEYDSSGRMVLDEAQRVLSYDVVGRLSSINKDGGISGSYGYDALNRLVNQKIGGDGSRQLFYRGGELVNEILIQQDSKSNSLKNDQAFMSSINENCPLV